MAHQKHKLGFAENFALSCAAAVISKTALSAPIERVKLFLQNQDEMIKAGRLDRPYKGVIDCIVRTYKNEGLLSFWRYNLARCIRYFPTQALNFAFKDKFQALFKSGKNESYTLKFSKNIASGGAAGAMSLCFVYSLDSARIRLANDARHGANERQFTGLIDVYRKTLKTEGIAGLHRGFAHTATVIIVYRGCYFGCYDTLKPIILGENAGLLASFALGYVVTQSAHMISHPIDRIPYIMNTAPRRDMYKGYVDCAIKIIKNGQFMFLMTRAGADNVLRSLTGAGVLAGFDKFKEIYIARRPVASFTNMD